MCVNSGRIWRQRASEPMMIRCSEMRTEETSRLLHLDMFPPRTETKEIEFLQSVPALIFSLYDMSLMLSLMSYILYLINFYMLLSRAWSRDVGSWFCYVGWLVLHA